MIIDAFHFIIQWFICPIYPPKVRKYTVLLLDIYNPHLLSSPVAHINMLKWSLETKAVCPAEALLLKRWWTQNKIYTLVMPSQHTHVGRFLDSRAWFCYLLKCIAFHSLADTSRLWAHSVMQTNFPTSSRDAVVRGLQRHVLCRSFLFCCCALKWFGMLSLCMVQKTELSLYINFALNTFSK